MARKTGKELEELMKKHNVNTIWSWSRFNCHVASPYEFFLKYILKEKEDAEPSIYGVQGGLIHEIIERFYLGKIKYEDMINEYEDCLFKLQLQGLKYNRVDEESNTKVGIKYEGCIREFFKNHKKINHKMHIEKFIDIKVGRHLYQGYIDAVCKIGDKVYILDWKSSTEYTGEKAQKELGQLKLYAYGLYKKGIKAEDILVGWIFLKYYTFTFIQKNGKEKSMNIERVTDPMEVKTIKNNIDGKLKELGYIVEDYADYKFEELPDDIKNYYKVEDCITTFSHTAEQLEEFASEVALKTDEIVDKMKIYEETEDEEIWLGEVVDSKNVFYFNNLAGYSYKKHKPFAEYIENAKMFMID